MVDRIKEQYNTIIPEPVSLKITEKIVEQMKNSICRIENNCKGTGFFVKVPYKSELLPVLITNNRTLGESQILNDITITLYLNNKKECKYIKLNNQRKDIQMRY